MVLELLPGYPWAPAKMKSSSQTANYPDVSQSNGTMITNDAPNNEREREREHFFSVIVEEIPAGSIIRDMKADFFFNYQTRASNKKNFSTLRFFPAWKHGEDRYFCLKNYIDQLQRNATI